jgi:hypothetical protein
MVCPNCGAPLPLVRIPKTLKEMIRGGWTCDRCGIAIDRLGKPREEQSPLVSREGQPPALLTPEQIARNRAAAEASQRSLRAAFLAFAAGLVPVVLCSLFGGRFYLVLAANLIGTLIATWQASARALGRLLFLLPAAALTFGVGIASWYYLLAAGERHVSQYELLLPAVLGALPGIGLWAVASLIHPKLERR